MKTLGLTLLSCLAITPTYALLPPLYQTSAEMRAILADAQLGQKLQAGEILTKIEKNAEGYELTTNKSQLQVYVIDEPLQKPGPARYTLRFGDPIPFGN